MSSRRWSWRSGTARSTRSARRACSTAKPRRTRKEGTGKEARWLPWIGGIQSPAATADLADTVERLLFGALTELLGDGGLERRQMPQRVLVVDLANHFVRQAGARDVPAAVTRRAARRAHLGGMLEVLVVGLEEPP